MTGAGGGRRVFVSHTSELREYPAGRSYVAAVEQAISACGDVVVDMSGFPAADQPAAGLCIDRVRSCDVYVGVLGTRYGSPVPDRADVSYTELEFGTATAAGLKRLVFLLDTGASDVGIPPSALIDHQFGARQEEFRRRVQDSGLVTAAFTDPGTLGQLVERSLRELAGQGTGRDARAAGPAAGVVVTGEIPQQPLAFQVRASLLTALDGPGDGSPVRVVSALTGMRGVGKTHLAAAYARARIADGWQLVAWINAEEETSLLAGLAETADALGLRADEERAAGRALRHRLEADGDRCLLVFDNATDLAVLRPFVPAAGACRVIVTSNHQSMAALGTDVPVDVFSEPEALTFLAARTGLADADGAQALAAAVGFLPLALAQAAAVIAGQHLTYATFLDRLSDQPATRMLTPDETSQYPHGVAATILLALDAVGTGDQGEACAAVMTLLAVLSPAGVRRSLVRALAHDGLPGKDGSLPGLAEDEVDRVLGRLAGASLLTFSVDGTSISVHRLVSRVLREHLAAAGALTGLGQRAAGLLDRQAQSLSESWHQDRAGARDLAEQITALTEHAGAWASNDDLTRAVVRLTWWAVVFLSRLGDSAAQAIVLGEQLVQEQERLLGPDHPDTLTSRNNLAVDYWEVGRTEEAVTLDERVLAARERILGPDHPDTLSSRNNLAVDYWEVGRVEEAVTLNEQTLAARERILGPDHPDTLDSRNNLAISYRAAGRVEEAITLNEQVLAARERTLGPDHPDTLTSRNNLAIGYRDADRVEEAITLDEQVLASRERILGLDHPDTRRSRRNLADDYQAAGRAAPGDRDGAEVEEP